jgi:hypothetical protein
VEQREYFRAGCGVWTGKATVALPKEEETRVLEIEYQQEYDALYIRSRKTYRRRPEPSWRPAQSCYSENHEVVSVELDS